MECLYCGKKYIAYDSDAGTYKEHFCSNECEGRAEDAQYQENPPIKKVQEF